MPKPKRTANPFRLSRDVNPVFYDLRFEPDLEAFTFRGFASIEVDVRRTTRQVRLHAAELKIRAARWVSGKQSVPARRIREDKRYETATLDFARPVPAGRRTRLEIEYDGELNDKMHGFYRTSYEVGGKKRWGAATQFEATDARRAFPCWDEPDRKARFRVTLTVPKALTALSNMPVESESVRADTKTLVYAVTPVMSTYLVCLVVADLEFVEGRDPNGVPIRVYTTPGKKEQGHFALEVAQHALAYFARWFGIPYAFPKLDMVALPDFASGAMENWGLVTYRETALLVDPAQSSAAARQRVAEVIDHELAHQWFGNLVTMEWWTDLWLNEGFASYMGPKAVADRFPEWDVWTQFLASEYLVALQDDSLRNSHPIEIDVRDPAEIREIFDHITYNKGASVNRMLEHYLGEPAFRAGLRTYLKRYAYGNARTTDLWKALQKTSGKPVPTLMAGYTRQTGYPVVTVRESRAARGLRLRLMQRRFRFDGSADPKRPRWAVPVAVAAEGLRRPVEAFFKGRTAAVTVPTSGEGWVKLNPGQSGFYRTAYSPALFARLSRAVAARRLPAIERLGVVDDAFALARAGMLPTTAVLDLVDGCRTEDDYNVWLVLSGILGAVENILDAATRPRLKAFGRAVVGPAAARSGWDARPGDGHLVVLLRALLLGRLGHFGDAGTVEEARRRFAAGGVDPNLRSPVYMLAAEHGGAPEYDRLMRIYRDSTLQEEKVRVLRAITRFRDGAVVRRALEFALSPDVRRQDTYVVLAGFGGNDAAREAGWEFIKSKWTVLTKLFDKGSVGLLAHILEGAVSGFTEPARLKDIEAFLRRHRVRGTERAVKQSIEFVRANIAWARRDGDAIRRRLA